MFLIFHLLFLISHFPGNKGLETGLGHFTDFQLVSVMTLLNYVNDLLLSTPFKCVAILSWASSSS